MAADDFTKFFADLKLPAMPNAEALMAAQKRNMEAFTAANRIALEGAQAVAKRHMEIMQQTMAELIETMRGFSSPQSPQDSATHNADILKRSYERAVANAKELSDLIQRSNSEALATLNKRFAEAMDEVKSLVEKAKA